MAAIKNGYDWYLPLPLMVGFPEGKVACCYCPALRKDGNTGGHNCWLTGEKLKNIITGIGNECRLREVEAESYGNKGEDLSEVESIANGVKGPEGTI